MDTSLGEFGSIETFADGEDYKEACNDLEYHEKLINEQNVELEATLKRLQDQALERNAEAADSPEAAEDDMVLEDVDQAAYKKQAEACQVNISVAHAKQEELQRLIAELEPRPSHAL